MYLDPNDYRKLDRPKGIYITWGMISGIWKAFKWLRAKLYERRLSK